MADAGVPGPSDQPGWGQPPPPPTQPTPAWGEPAPTWGQPAPGWDQQQPQPGQPPAAWGQPVAAAPGPGGTATYYGRPVGRRTSPGTAILLAIVTLGIYTLVWTYRQHEDVKRYSGNGVGGGIGLVLAILTGGVATYFLLPHELESLYRNEGQVCPVNAVTGFWLLLPLVGPLVWYFKVQDALNAFWQQRGAPAP